MIGAFAHGALFVALLVGTFSDLRTREVPDWLNYALISVGVAAGVFSSIIQGSVEPLTYSVLGLLIGIAVGYAMYYSGQWGGGDAKLFMGMGAIIGLNFSQPLFSNEFLAFAIWWVVAGSVYGLVWTLYLAFKHWSVFRKAYLERIRDPKLMVQRKMVQGITVLLILSFFFVPPELKPIVILIALLVFGLFYLFVSVQCVESTAMIKKVSVKKLTEGDWLVQDVKVKGKSIVKVSSTGLTLAEIKRLQKHPRVFAVIKEGIPFVPVFLIAYLALMLVGSPLGILA